jgi:hypothetical protein
MAKMNYYYKRKENLRPYSGIAAGIRFQTVKNMLFNPNSNLNTEKITDFVGQFTAFGIEKGAGRVNPFFELGLGTSSGLNAGPRIRF